MGTTTKNLGLYKPDANDYYNVEKDQNENFDKIDEKFGEVDNGLKTKLDKGSYEGSADDLKREIDDKEPNFEKKSGFNKEKTSEYKSGKDAEKLFTQEGANSLYKEVKAKRDKTDNLFNSLEIKYTTPYIDFRVNNTDEDYTYRIIGDSEGLYYVDKFGVIFKFKDVLDKVSKRGDTVAGNLRVLGNESNFIIDAGQETYTGSLSRGMYLTTPSGIKGGVGWFGYQERAGHFAFLGCGNDHLDQLRIYYDNTAQFKATNLKTPNKEVIKDLNYLYSKFTDELVNADGVIWRDVGRYSLTRALNPDYEWTYIYTSDNNNYYHIIRVKTSEALSNMKFISYSHDEYKGFYFGDATTFYLTENRYIEGQEQNIVRKIVQRHI